MRKYLVLPAEIIKKDVFKNGNVFKVYMVLIMYSAFANCEITIKGRMFQLKKGQLITTAKFISMVSGIDELVVNQNISWLKKMKYIDIESVPNAVKITILNYEDFTNVKYFTNKESAKEILEEVEIAEKEKSETKEEKIAKIIDFYAKTRKGLIEQGFAEDSEDIQKLEYECMNQVKNIELT